MSELIYKMKLVQVQDVPGAIKVTLTGDEMRILNLNNKSYV